MSWHLFWYSYHIFIKFLLQNILRRWNCKLKLAAIVNFPSLQWLYFNDSWYLGCDATEKCIYPLEKRSNYLVNYKIIGFIIRFSRSLWDIRSYIIQILLLYYLRHGHDHKILLLNRSILAVSKHRYFLKKHLKIRCANW